MFKQGCCTLCDNKLCDVILNGRQFINVPVLSSLVTELLSSFSWKKLVTKWYKEQKSLVGFIRGCWEHRIEIEKLLVFWASIPDNHDEAIFVHFTCLCKLCALLLNFEQFQLCSEILVQLESVSDEDRTTLTPISALETTLIEHVFL